MRERRRVWSGLVNRSSGHLRLVPQAQAGARKYPSAKRSERHGNPNLNQTNVRGFRRFARD